MSVVRSYTSVSRASSAANKTFSKIILNPDEKVGLYQLLGESACPSHNYFSYYITLYNFLP